LPGDSRWIFHRAREIAEVLVLFRLYFKLCKEYKRSSELEMFVVRHRQGLACEEPGAVEKVEKKLKEEMEIYTHHD